MNLLVTAGNTAVPIDHVRTITNVFSGKTGAQIALTALERGHAVTLLTSRPEVIAELSAQPLPADRWKMQIYSTFDDLQGLLADQLLHGRYDSLVHGAAVSDYQVAGVYAPEAQTRFLPSSLEWQNSKTEPPRLSSRAAGKVKSDEPELWLRLVRTTKLVDRVRTEWKFNGILVKFKLEVDISEEELLTRAEQSRRHSRADVMVANLYESRHAWAWLGSADQEYVRLPRAQLSERLLREMERIYEGRPHG